MGSDKIPKVRRSQGAYGKNDKDGFIHRSWMKAQGFPEDVFDGRPVIGICNTWSEITPCNSHLRELAEFVKRGVWEMGGLPLEFPVSSLGETQMRPTAMLFRNLLAMDVEESIRANPIDGVVLMGGCDKTSPGQLMGAASVDLPTMIVSSGPMLNGKFRGRDIGSGTDVWKFDAEVKAGRMTQEEFMAAETGMSRSRGVCMTMGSASSFASVAEALGVALPMNGTAPGVVAERQRISHQAGREIVRLVKEDLCLSHFLTREAFENAIKVHAAIGGSTNTVIHLLAVAGRLGIDLTLDDFDALTQGIPLLTNVQPSGKYLMEEFHYAGGVPGVFSRLGEHLHGDAPTVSGRSIKEISDRAEIYMGDVICTLEDPVKKDAGTIVLRGNICPDGAIMKPSAASPELLQHTGPALVFEDIEDYKARIDDPDLDVTKDTVLVLRGCGPRGYPGMPEVGNMALPQKLLAQGVEDMVRVSDARMSGTAFGTVVLHVCPEATAGGPLGLVRTGDIVKLDAKARTINVDVTPEELEKRTNPAMDNFTPESRGYVRLYQTTVEQADTGCDLDFLKGGSGSDVKRESH
nr:IlvD/Edd family dehydratase [Robiginitomaculum antarcticum]